VRCPRCGFEQPEAVKCARCSIIVARYRERGIRPSATRQAAAPAAGGRRPDGKRASLTALALVIILGPTSWWLLVGRSDWHGGESGPSVRPAPTPQAVSLPSAAPGTPMSPDSAPSPSPQPTIVAKPATCPLFASGGPPLPSRRAVSSEWYTGADGFEQAEREQRDNHAPVLLYFYTSWCPYCRRLDNEILSAPDVERFMRYEIVKIRVNPESGVGEHDLANRFGVHSYPALFVLVEGQLVGARLSSYGAGSGSESATPGDLVVAIQDAVTGWVAGQLSRASEKRQRGDAADALATLDSVLAVAPNEGRAYLQRGVLHAERDERPAAIEDLRHAAELLPDETTLYGWADQVLGRDGRWSEAAACWSHLIERAPRDGRALLSRGNALAQAGDRERALVDLREACRIGERFACDLATRLGG
jgi:thioredoxin-like negative regulator of GroEL